MSQKQSKSKETSKQSDQNNQETIMLFCAHPDDEILGAGGTIAKYSQQGKKVIAIIFSYGENSHWWLKRPHTVEMRVKESRAAGKVVGTHETIFLGMKDFELKNEIKNESKIKLIEKLINKHDPSKIFTHSPDDMIYSDHLAVWSAINTATKNVKFKGDLFVFNIWAKNVRVGQNPKLIVDISDTFNLKWQAMKCFKSQHMYIFQLYPGVIWRALKCGWENRSRFAESFVKMR